MHFGRLFAHVPHTRHPVFVVDIGSGSVALAIIDPGEGQNPSRIIASTRTSIKLSQEARPDIATLLPGIIETIKTAIESFVVTHVAQVKSVKDIHVVLHAPWATCSAGEASSEFGSERTIRDADVSALAKQAVGTISAESGSVFERAVMRAEVNGYPTNSPEGKHGVSLKVIALQSNADENVISSVRDATLAGLPGRTITFHAATYAYLAILQPLARSVPYYTFVDITSELSQIFIVKNGMLVGNTTAQAGWRTLIRALAEHYHTSPEDALSRFRMLRDETGTSSSCEEMVNSLGELATALTTAYGNAFTELTAAERLPATVIISAPPDLAPWFVDFFGRIDFSQFSVTEHPFSVQLLLARHLAKKVEFEHSLVPDAGIAAAAAFVHTLMEHE